MSCWNPLQDQPNSGDEVKETIWNYFSKSDDGTGAVCSLCFKMLKISKGSYKGLRVHLLKKHGISVTNVQSKRPYPEEVVPFTSKQEQDATETIAFIYEEEAPRKKHKIADTERNMETMVSRMVCRDGYTFNTFCTSSDLRYLFSNCGYSLPNSPSSIRAIVFNFAEIVRADMISELEQLKKQDQRFALTIDERTCQNSRRYLNLTVHQREKHFNLGLIRILSDVVGLIKDRLSSFGIDFDSDVVGITAGESVIGYVGKPESCHRQLCFAQSVQLAVIDVLYKKETKIKVEANETSIESDEDDETNEGAAVVTESNSDFPSIKLLPTYSDLLQKVRKSVKLLKKSPSEYLENYFKLEKGEDVNLTLDCQTRWSSLLDMMEKFYNLKVSIDESLLAINFDDREWSTIKDLINCLQPCKLAVEALCRRDATLLTAETIFKFVFEKLDKQNTNLSSELSKALSARIKERRDSSLTGILLYLNNPKKYEQNTRQADGRFPIPNKNFVRQEMARFLTRVVKDEEVEATFDENSSSSESPLPDRKLTLQEELDMQIRQDKEEYRKTINLGREFDIESTLRREMSSFETDGVRGKYLSLVYDQLITVKPSSVEAERAFSATGDICGSLRSSLGDDTIDTIYFLRSFFQNHDS